MVDCSHGNSSKDHTRQPVVFTAVLDQILAGSPHIVGMMLESHLHPGNQQLGRGAEGLKYGVSVTDPCIDWETTERLLHDADRALRSATRATPLTVPLRRLG
jgi:3-deoxy-7-phosphoheptulonate synthase